MSLGLIVALIVLCVATAVGVVGYLMDKSVSRNDSGAR
jgi:hypothetical protein